jgi:hypothetical protein
VYADIQHPAGVLLAAGGVIQYNMEAVNRIVRVSDTKDREVTFSIGTGFGSVFTPEAGTANIVTPLNVV